MVERREKPHYLPMQLAFVMTMSAMLGCSGGQESSVEGVVTLNGTPLSRGSVTFVPVEQGASATAEIRANGRYVARTASTVGLKPGEYLVAVRAREDATPNPSGGAPAAGKLITPEKYGNSATSGFRFSVNPGANEINLDLKS